MMQAWSSQSAEVMQSEPLSTARLLKSPRTLACRRCRQKKQKCDNAKPKCGHCNRAGVDCLPTVPSTSKSDYPNSYVEALQNRIVLLEEQLRESNPNVVNDHLHHQGNPQSRQRASNTVPRPRQPGSVSSSASHDSRSFQMSDDHLIRGNGHDMATGSMSNPFQGDLESGDFHAHLIIPPSSLESDGPIHFLSNLTYSPSNKVTDDPFDMQAFRETPDQVASLLVSIYFHTIHPQYPFLHRGTWEEILQNWKQRSLSRGSVNPEQAVWEEFVVSMVFAIGALIADKSLVGVNRSRSYYNIATKIFLPLVLKEAPLLSQTQSFLLLAMHALHCSSSAAIIQLNSNAIRAAVMAGLHRRERRGVLGSSTVLEIESRRRTWWSCYALDRAVATGFNHPVSVPDEYITVELFADIDDASLTPSTTVLTPRAPDNPEPTNASAPLHKVRARQIQSRILAALAQTETMDPALRSQFSAELDNWRASISQVAKPDRGYESRKWLEMIYYYCVIILLPPTREELGRYPSSKVITASCNACLAFRDIQRGRQTAHPWLALLAQLQAGVTILYCFWVTPLKSRSPEFAADYVSRAIRACSNNLVILAERWEKAEVYRDVFELLAKEISVNNDPQESPLRRLHEEDSSTLEDYLSKLKVFGAHSRVLEMIEEICREERPLASNTPNRDLTELLEQNNPTGRSPTYLMRSQAPWTGGEVPASLLLHEENSQNTDNQMEVENNFGEEGLGLPSPSPAGFGWSPSGWMT